MTSKDDYCPIKEPLIKSAQEVLNEMENLSMHLIKVQRQVDETKATVDSNPNQKDFYQVMSDLEQSEGNLADYSTQFDEAKKEFGLIGNASSSDQGKFQRFSTKIEEVIASLHKKLFDLRNETRKIKMMKKYDDTEIAQAASTNSMPFESKMFKKNVIDQKAHLDQRGENLKNAKIVSAQLNQMSKDMNIEIDRQGNKLNQIENNVISIKDEVNQASDNIEEANAENKKKNKKLLAIILIIAFVVAAAVTISLIIIYKT